MTDQPRPGHDETDEERASVLDEVEERGPVNDDADEGAPAERDEGLDDEAGPHGEEAAVDEGEEPQAGWLHDADDADDADVGDLAEGIADGGEESWLDDDANESAEGDGSIQDEGGAWSSDDAEEGPLESDLELDEPDAFRIDLGADDGDDGAGDESVLAAFALAPPVRGAAERIETSGAVRCAGVADRKVVLAGEGIELVPIAGEALERARVRRVADIDATIVALATDEKHCWALASDGTVLRSDGRALTWTPVGSLPESRELRNPALHATSAREPVLLAFASGRMWRSRDGGARWEPLLATHAIRCAAWDAANEQLVAWLDVEPPRIARCGGDGDPVLAATPIVGAPVRMAWHGAVGALHFAGRGAYVTVDGGRNAQLWPLLEGNTAWTIVETNDGALQLLASIHDETADATTVVAAVIGSDGTPRGARRVADVTDERARGRIETVLALGAHGRGLLLLGSSGAWTLARDEG